MMVILGLLYDGDVVFSECDFFSSILQAYEEAQKRLKMAEEDQRKIVSLSFRKN